MLLSPKWQTIWLESQHCSKNIVNVPLPSQQTQKVLEDLRVSCCSPNKTVQLEALKCWGIWINNQNPDDWKLNTVCFTAVRPLITKKLQPLHKDVDICKIRLSLLWALLVKVQNIMHLEGPQYILEVFLQSCLTWLSSTSGDGCGNEISNLIFQLLLAIFKKEETLNGCVKEMFPQFATNIFHIKKVYHQFVDKFLNIFIYWRKVQDRNVILKLWKHFLEQCELSCEHIPIPVWHKIFKLAAQICSEKSEPVKDRLAFLHSCATILKSALSSSKFIDFGNLLTTPCEALIKKLVELCTVEFKEFFDSDMFFLSKEICEVLSNRSVAIGGFDLCISLLDILEEFSLRSLFWGVWCGLVYCYEVQLLGTERSHFTKTQMKFYRKLRGVAINFELDRNKLHSDCKAEVEKRILALNLSCFCTFPGISEIEKRKVKDCHWSQPELNLSELQPVPINFSIVKVAPTQFYGKFSKVTPFRKSNLVLRKSFDLKVDLIKDILKSVGINCAEPLLDSLLNFRFITLKTRLFQSLGLARPGSFNFLHPPEKLSLCLTNGTSVKKENVLAPCLKARTPSHIPECSPSKKNKLVNHERDEKTETEEETISVRKTRSKQRAEEEKRREMERHSKRKRKSFEVLVQEIVRKNKERKTEKNCKKRKTPVVIRSARINKKSRKIEKEIKMEIKKNKKKPLEVSDRKLRDSRKEEPKGQKKEKKPIKADGKLENYFKVITKKSGFEMKKDEKKCQKKKKANEEKKPSKCCIPKRKEKDGKIESGWRQTSLKAMMKNKTEKVKQGSRARNKHADVADEKIKGRNESKKVIGSSLAQLSPFKEVFHDHEYAKLEPEKLQRFEEVLFGKKTMKGGTSKKRKKSEKAKPHREEDIILETEVIQEEESEKLQQVETFINDEFSESTTVEFIPMEESTLKVEEENHVRSKEENKTLELKNLQEEEKEEKMVVDETEAAPVDVSANDSELEKTIVHQTVANDVSLQESSEEMTDVEFKNIRRGRKRIKMLDSLKPSNKKIKLKEDDLKEEKLPLDVTEKENLEEKPDLISLTERGKVIAKNEGSPVTVNAIISSRALRMIALVPESTKGGQIQRESSNRVEILKCRKAPNVDKYSRASKMLALLSENVVELEEVDDVKIEELNSNKVISTTPNMKTPVSSLKSPKSIRKRRSIRFDDAKNETVLYQTDTPPSQIVLEKEKCRRIRPSEIILNLP